MPPLKASVNLRNMSQFRPISLYNVLYKIISKMMVNRFQRVVDICIDEAQSAFVLGRFISNNIFIAYEILHSFKKRRVGKMSCFALKLDMSKVYDESSGVF
ncbi:reverse transcriptase [Gossypium australe]|uniref:Reverse transcriptase n=1 Tax=Gossypium australe TaxID=47621 RepID=A0A5B6WV95_9ROSI|nr:reverse transcriptase [Gossypium australe]